MATLTIRNLDEKVKTQLRITAARNGVSMEEQARRLLVAALVHDGSDEPRQPLGTTIHQLFADVDGAELELPGRTDPPRAADFEP